MYVFISQTKRNIKLFFKDKGVFFTSLVTPLILLVLYATFLANVYKDSFYSAFQEGFALDEKLVDGIVGGQLLSSLLAVSCITVAFCSNMIMVQDKVSGVNNDFLISPVKPYTLALSYFFATFINTFVVSVVAFSVGLIYIYFVGWYLTFADILLILLDIFMLTLFGTSLSSIISCFLTSQGQISAVGTIVSSCYGFICGAYMPISSFGKGLQNILSFLPGTYGTSLIKNHCLKGSFWAMEDANIPTEIIDGIKQSIDCNIKFFDTNVSTFSMYVIMILSITICIVSYIIINILKNKKNK